LERQLLREFFETTAKFRKMHMIRLDGGGLHKGEHMILLTIRDREAQPGKGVQASQLSEMHHISRPAISQMVRALERKGMVERAPDGDDRRIVWIRVTPKGDKAVSRAGEAFMDFTAEVIGRLGEEDARALIRIMGRLSDVIDDMRREGKLNMADRCDGMK
jgi:DNA-binding MarR family transcriptional regulator